MWGHMTNRTSELIWEAKMNIDSEVLARTGAYVQKTKYRRFIDWLWMNPTGETLMQERWNRAGEFYCDELPPCKDVECFCAKVYRRLYGRLPGKVLKINFPLRMTGWVPKTKEEVMDAIAKQKVTFTNHQTK